jgi:hypothetical protein
MIDDTDEIFSIVIAIRFWSMMLKFCLFLVEHDRTFGHGPDELCGRLSIAVQPVHFDEPGKHEISKCLVN